MSTDKQIAQMLRLMASNEVVEVTNRWGSVKKLAGLAFIAEQFGFAYYGAEQSGANDGAVKMQLYRDPSPYAQQRAAATWAQFPQAGNGGPLPGIQPGGKLKPVPEAAPAVELLKARINFDLTGKSAEKRMMWGAIGFTVGGAIGVARGDFFGLTMGIGLGLWAFCMALLGFGFIWTRRRNQKYAALLASAGFVPVRDETGRTRFLRPDQQLPGHANPFANPYGAGPAPQGRNPYSGGPQGAAPYGPPQ
ncbi:hypothetical protein [Streptomyces sp. 7N604]|uniref:hypothetical protein n=1 Tax=Streptomyces sp. 7N604 TaxID=3457415 RepID=UPI003FCFDCCF